MNAYYYWIEQVKEYHQIMGNDPNIFLETLRDEMKNIGVIDGGEKMHWNTPDKMYRFEIERFDNMIIQKDTDPKYLNIIKIFNNINCFIREIRFNEFDCVRILGGIAEYVNAHFNEGYNDIYSIYINPNNTEMITTIITLEFSSVNTYCKVIIQEYNPAVGIFIDVISFILDYQQLVDMSFMIFFQCLIDIDTDELAMSGYNEELRLIGEFVYGKPMCNNNYLKDAKSNLNKSQQYPYQYTTNSFQTPNIQIDQNYYAKTGSATKAKPGSILGLYKFGERKL